MLYTLERVLWLPVVSRLVRRIQGTCGSVGMNDPRSAQPGVRIFCQRLALIRSASHSYTRGHNPQLSGHHVTIENNCCCLDGGIR